jgi:hypothetical protein
MRIAVSHHTTRETSPTLQKNIGELTQRLVINERQLYGSHGSAVHASNVATGGD